jgi:hypothetical protein
MGGAVAVVACGGGIATIGNGDDGGGSGDGSGTGDGSGSNDSGSTGDAIGRDGPQQPTCEDLRKAIDNLRPAARKCCPTCNHAPCEYTAQDLCCALTVDVPSSNDITAFENAIAAFKAAGCQYPCPGIPCPPAPSGKCDPNTSMCL